MAAMVPMRSLIIILSVLVSMLSACSGEYIHEPWMDGRGEQAKQKWENPRAPQQLNEMRTRLLETQSDH